MSAAPDLFAPWSLGELVAELRSGRTTPARAHDRALERIAETEPTLHAWVSTEFAPLPDGLDGTPLGGVPMGVKDIIDLRGYPTRCGSVLRRDAAPAEADATIVGAWRRAGGAPLGQTVTTEFAFFAPGPTDNPAALGHTPGGSSSGSAAAVAAGQVPLALGSQTAGSVTRPAAFCGVASLVMTRGRYPVDGVVGLAESLDSHGVYAAGTEDLAVAWTALTGEAVAVRSRPERILLWDAEGAGDVDDDMAEALDRAAFALRAAGAVVDAFPESALAAELTVAHPQVMAYEAARERAAELAQADRLSDPLAGLLRTGAAMSDADYAAARAIVERGATRVAELLGGADLILGPAALGGAPAGLSATGDPVLSRAWQALGLPTVAVPGLRNAQGLPLGLQTIGAAGGDAARLGAASWVQAGIAPR